MRNKKQFIIAANWKMYKSPLEAEKFFEEFLPLQKKFSSKIKNIFFVPTLDLFVAAKMLTSTNVMWGAQNIYFETEGAFTGENSPKVLKEIGAQVCLVGHSERRALFSETDEVCAKKVKAAQAQGLVPMLCVGESLEERKSGKTNEVITDQLKKSLSQFDPTKDFTLAYEPVWAIGTGQVATHEQAGEAHLILRQALRGILGEDKSESTPILYGGSVKPENAKELALEEQIDGFLIGGASLAVGSLVQIANFA